MLKKKNILLRIIAMFVAVALLIPASVVANATETVQPRASDYLSVYNAYTYPEGSGKVSVYFTVLGTGYMDELGALSIEIYESKNGTTWDWVKTYKFNSTSGMLSYNDNYHSGHVTYNGVAGRYYKALVCVWGGKNGQGDTRYFWTSPKLAT